MELENGNLFLEDEEARNGQPHPGPEEEPTSSFVDVALDIATRHRRALIRIALIAAIASGTLAFLLPKQYDSTARIMPPEGPNPLAALAAVSGKVPAGLADLAGGMMGIKNTGPLWVNLLQSRTILDDQISNFNLLSVYKTKHLYRARKKLVSNTNITEDHKSGVITITVSDTDKARAQKLADGYVNELNQLLASVSTSAARRERIFIEQRLNTAKKDLETAEVEFSQYASKNSTFDLQEQTKAIVGAGAQLEGQIIAAQSELEGLQQTYTDENIRVRQVKARIASMKRELAKLGGTGEEPRGSMAPGDLSPPIRQLPLVGVQWADLYRRTKIQETVFELLTQQYELAKIQEAKEVPTVKVIDPADFPEKKSWPPRGLFVLIGTILAIVAAGFWFKIKEDWDALPPDNPTKVRAYKFHSLLRNNHKTSTPTTDNLS